MKVKIPHKGEMREGYITACKRNSDGILIGIENNNPILDTREYKIDFGEGYYSEYTANTIIENLHSQVDDDGSLHTLIKGIVNIRNSDNALPSSRGWITIPSKIHKRVITTEGWDLLAKWVDGIT